MQLNSMTVTCARITHEINKDGGAITPDELTDTLSEHGVNQQEAGYIKKLQEWKHLWYNRVDDTYHTTVESKLTATITITVPQLLADEARRDMHGRYVGYSPLIKVGEVELTDQAKEDESNANQA